MTESSSHPIFHRGVSPRRSFLGHTFDGLSALALTSLLGSEQSLRSSEPESIPAEDHPYRAKQPHFPARVDQVIMVVCAGALSQMDTFDYKPELLKRDGEPLPGSEQLLSFQGKNGNLVRPLWKFRPSGQCGKMISDLTPHIAELADDLCFIHSLHSKTNTHGPGESVMSTGFTNDGFPSMGAWVSFALGTPNEDLPAFVAIEDPRGIPQAGPNNWSAGFLPAAFQGTPMSTTRPIRFLQRPPSLTDTADGDARNALQFLNRKYAELNPHDTALSARIASYELAARMQLSVPNATAVDSEPAHILRLYGADQSKNKIKQQFARNCILARRLVERGVRFVQLFNGAYASGGSLNWDAHNFIEEQYAGHAEILDQPVAGLLKDLKQRGMLKNTLVVFCTEFGRMPTFQKGTRGRDHNPHGFTCWLAGAGVKTPFSYGATDEFGYRAIENRTTVHDFHATLLHLLGLDHEQLTFYHNGLERRLTDVHGHVIHDLLA